MSQLDRPFPFSAVVGQEDAKLALLLTAVDPAIGGVLLRGDKGSAKTTLARGLAALLARGDDQHMGQAGPSNSDRHESGPTGVVPFVELPVGATEDRVLGSLDVNLLVNGDGDSAAAFRPGLLAAAHGGVLYVDEVNLLPDHLVDGLLDAAASGVNRVERDGVSYEHPARFVLLGSMNPEEGELRPQLLDRFGLAVEVRAPADPGLRAEAVRRRLAHDAGHSCEATARSRLREDARRTAETAHRSTADDAAVTAEAAAHRLLGRGRSHAPDDADTPLAQKAGQPPYEARQPPGAEPLRQRSVDDGDRRGEEWDADAELRQQLAHARPAPLPDQVITMAARLAVEVGAESLRADLVLCRAAAALADWEGRPVTTEDDVARVAPLALGHRRRRRPFDPPTLPPEQLDAALQAVGYDPRRHDGTEPPAGAVDDTGAASAETRNDGARHDEGAAGGPRPDDPNSRHTNFRGTDSGLSTGQHHPDGRSSSQPSSGGQDADGRRLDATDAGPTTDGTEGRGRGSGVDAASRSTATGRRWDELTPDAEDANPKPGAIGLLSGPDERPTRPTSPGRPGPANGGNGGRVVGHHLPGPDGSRGVAVVPTVRAVVERRASNPEGPALHPDDLREPRRLPREHRTVVVVVDTSGSMGTEARVRAASGAVLGLLADAYLSRDQVALVAFRGDDADEVLPPTASVELARARLADLPTGGSTPLAEGISAGLATARREAAKQVSPLLVLLTDGRATGHPEALDDARAAARAVADTGVETLVLDAEDGDPRVRLGLSAELAELMNARYLHLSAIDASTVEAAVRATLR